MRDASHKLRAPLALLYLLLGMTAAWHALDDIYPSSEIAYQTGDSGSTNPVVNADGLCVGA